MKLLNANKAEVAFLDEGTTKLVYYGKDPALVYFTGATKDAGPDTCVVTKVASLTGYIETDAKNLVKIEGTLEEKIAILETVFGCKIGYANHINGANQLPEKTVKFYKSVDTSDTGTITIKVLIGDEEKALEFTRGPNAVTVKDLLKKLKTEIGDRKPIVSISAGEDKEVILTKADKLLEDQTVKITFDEEPTDVNPNPDSGADTGDNGGDNTNTESQTTNPDPTLDPEPVDPDPVDPDPTTVDPNDSEQPENPDTNETGNTDTEPQLDPNTQNPTNGE